MQPLGTKKNHATFWDKKITQPLGSKTIMRKKSKEKPDDFEL